MQTYKRYIAALLLGSVSGQWPGTLTEENHLSLKYQKCTVAGGCKATKTPTTIVLDSNWRQIFYKDGNEKCYSDGAWDNMVCADPDSCAKSCTLGGVGEADWKGTYGISSGEEGLKMQFVTENQDMNSKNVGSRVFMLHEEGKYNGYSYEAFKLPNKEFAFDIDVSKLPCGVKASVSFNNMLASGGIGKFTNNKAGAKYGTGYCDAQCPRDLKFINGKGNVEEWDSSTKTGKMGNCCAQMSIFDGNSISSSMSAHPCQYLNDMACDGSSCGEGDNYYEGFCDKDGCDLNTYRGGNTTFYGPGSQFTIDTTQKMTIVTQFRTQNNSSFEPIVEMTRIFIQGEKVLYAPNTNIAGMDSQYNSIKDGMCNATKKAFGDVNAWSGYGGMYKMYSSMNPDGFSLSISINDDSKNHMLWLDSNFPTDKTTPGGPRGTCATDSGAPADVEQNAADAYVMISNIKFGEIGSTFTGTPVGPTPGPTPPGPTPSGCPGGSLAACMDLCPTDPPAVWKACVAECGKKCTPPVEKLTDFLQ